jgi:hypothetical protein
MGAGNPLEGGGEMKDGFWRVWLLVLSLAFLGTAATPAVADDVPRMSIEELKAKLGDPQVVVLDVRAEADWNGSKSKIQGAARETASGIKTWAGKYPKDKTLVLYCA